MSARTTTSALRPGRMRTRCGSTVISTPFGAIAVLPDGDGEPSGRDVRDPQRRARRRTSPRPPRTRAATARRAAPAARRHGGRRALRPTPPGRDRRAAPIRRGAPCSARAPSVGRPCASTAATPAVTAAAALVPLIVPNRTSPSSPRPGSEVGTETPGAARSGFSAPSRTRPREENAAIEPSGLAARHLDVADGDRDGNARGEHRPDLGHDALGEADDRDAGRDVEAEGARRQRAVDEHGERAGRRRLLDRVVGERGAREEHRVPGDRAHAVLGEERRDPARGRAAIDEHDVGGHGLGRRAAERNVVLVEHAEPGANVHANRRRREAAVRSTDGHGVDRAAGAGDAAVAGACAGRRSRRGRS